jgi:hypothetical protein
MQRIQFEVPDERLQELEDLMKEAKITTKKDLLNNALTLFEWVLSEVKQGNAIAAIDESGQKYKEITMPVFRNVRRKQNLVPT